LGNNSICTKCWKDSYNPVVVAGHVDGPECWLFRLALLRGFGPDCRTVTLVNTSTVTIILRYRIILLIQNIQNTKLGKEGKKRKGKKICRSYLSLALHASLVSYSKFWASCLRPKCQVPEVQTMTHIALYCTQKRHR
jgi:hypothetical protein